MNTLSDFLNARTADRRPGPNKVASGDFSVRPGYMDAQHGMYRAMRSDDKGLGQLVADPELIKARLSKGLPAGALGALAGGLIGRRSGIGVEGATLGGVAGMGLGAHFGEDEYLRDRGVRRRLAGLLGADFTPEAAERYGVKAASVAEYSVLFDLVEEGKLGPHVKEAMRGVCEGLESSLHSGTKTASAPDVATEHDARQARLNQLLRR